MSAITLRKLKEILNEIPDKELDKPLIYNSDEYLMNGEIQSIHKLEETKYITDDCELLTLQELKEDYGYENEKQVLQDCFKLAKGYQILISFY